MSGGWFPECRFWPRFGAVKKEFLLKSRITAAVNLIHQVQEDQRTALIKSDPRDVMSGDVSEGKKLLF